MELNSRKKLIIVANNHWANIGDAFYQNSLIYDLSQIYGDIADVVSGEKHPCHIDPLLKSCQSNVFNYSHFCTPDWYVLSGPIFHKMFAKVYAPLLQKLNEHNVKIVLMSVGGITYDEEEVKICREVLQQYPPYILTTRDTQTYKAYSNFAKYSYDGICSAFYSSLQYPGYESPGLGKYIVYSFDMFKEPKVSLSISEKNSNKWLDKFKANSNSVRPLSMLDRLLDNFRVYPDSLEEFKIIRLHHTPLTKITPLIYNRPNTFVSLNPYSYLNIIRNGSLTLSTRVHACVTALSYQKPAMLFQRTKRSYLFERLGLQDIINKPVTLAREKLEKEHQKFNNFLKLIDI
jgi:hypothetical protein